MTRHTQISVEYWCLLGLGQMSADRCAEMTVLDMQRDHTSQSHIHTNHEVVHLGRVMSPHTNDSARALCGRTRQQIESPQSTVCPDPTYPHPGMSVRHHHTPPDRTPNPVNIAPPTKAVGVYVPAIPVPISRLLVVLALVCTDLTQVINGSHAGH